MSQRKWIRVEEPVITFKVGTNTLVNVPGYTWFTGRGVSSASSKGLRIALKRAGVNLDPPSKFLSFKKRECELEAPENWYFYFWSPTGKKGPQAIMIASPTPMLRANLQTTVTAWGMIVSEMLLGSSSTFNRTQRMDRLFADMSMYPEQAPLHLLEYLLS
jgi:hypothetical protein